MPAGQESSRCLAAPQTPQSGSLEHGRYASKRHSRTRLPVECGRKRSYKAPAHSLSSSSECVGSFPSPLIHKFCENQPKNPSCGVNGFLFYPPCHIEYECYYNKYKHTISPPPMWSLSILLSCKSAAIHGGQGHPVPSPVNDERKGAGRGQRS